jgi:hypothetical protein
MWEYSDTSQTTEDRRMGMLITSLEYMEKVVESRSDLMWIGWDVAKLRKSETAFYNTDGVLKDGDWYRQTIYPVTEKGWEVPASVGRLNA